MAEIEASLEGAIDVAPAAFGAGVQFQAVGVTVQFLPGVTASGRTKAIRTPAKTLTVGEFIGVTPLPGRTEPGFLKGTVIAEGVFDTVAGVFRADFLDVEPAENVLIGALTENAPGTPRKISINGVPVVMLTDSRMPSNPDAPAVPLYLNQYMFPMKIESAVISEVAPTSAEGYFAGSTFHAFKFDYGGTGQLIDDPATKPQVSIERASVRTTNEPGGGAEIEFEVRGWVTTAHAPGNPLQGMQLFRVDRNPVTGAPVETRVPLQKPKDLRITVVEPGVQRWRFDVEGADTRIPEKILVKNVSATGAVLAKAETDPDVREG